MSVTLQALEQEFSRRVGPFGVYDVDTAGTTDTVQVDDLQSSIDEGGLEGLWLLRRGLRSAGGAVPGFSPQDRQRRIASVDHDTGTLTVDRPYGVRVAAGERVEIGALDPARVVRPAVRTGLTRCFFEDRVTIAAPTGGSTGLTWAQVAGMTWAQLAQQTWSSLVASVPTARDRDLTALAAWLTKPTQLRSVSTGDPTGSSPLGPLEWWTWFTTGGALKLATDPDPYPGSLYVTALRPHSSWVNGADSLSGPTNDLDTLDVDLEYAVVAAHAYAWDAFRERLLVAARGGYAVPEDAVRRGWRVQIRAHVRPPPDRIQLPATWPGGVLTEAAS